jgi:hypothetical protein
VTGDLNRRVHQDPELTVCKVRPHDLVGPALEAELQILPDPTQAHWDERFASNLFQDFKQHSGGRINGANSSVKDSVRGFFPKCKRIRVAQ